MAYVEGQQFWKTVTFSKVSAVPSKDGTRQQYEIEITGFPGQFKPRMWIDQDKWPLDGMPPLQTPMDIQFTLGRLKQRRDGTDLSVEYPNNFHLFFNDAQDAGSMVQAGPPQQPTGAYGADGNVAPPYTPQENGTKAQSGRLTPQQVSDFGYQYGRARTLGGNIAVALLEAGKIDDNSILLAVDEWTGKAYMAELNHSRRILTEGLDFLLDTPEPLDDVSELEQELQNSEPIGQVEPPHPDLPSNNGQGVGHLFANGGEFMKKAFTEYKMQTADVFTALGIKPTEFSKLSLTELDGAWVKLANMQGQDVGVI